MSRLTYRLLPILLLAVSPAIRNEWSFQVRAQGITQVIATVGGTPDDITTDPKGRLVWGDLASGTIKRLTGKRVTSLASGLSVPEGILALSHGVLVVAEQGSDRIIRIGSRGAKEVLLQLQPVTGQEGVDGIGQDTRTGDLLIPDSPRGVVLRLNPKTLRTRVIATGLGRPVAAAEDSHGNVLVPDEHLGTLVVIGPHGRISHRGSFATPDDVAIDRQGRVWVTTLGDGGLWLIPSGGAPRQVLTGLANPQGLTLDRCGNPIVVEQNAQRILRLTFRSCR